MLNNKTKQTEERYEAEAKRDIRQRQSETGKTETKKDTIQRERNKTEKENTIVFIFIYSFFTTLGLILINSLSLLTNSIPILPSYPILIYYPLTYPSTHIYG
ncbi:MAG: hypothetical protein ACJAZS_000227 [Alteromonas naphthalenivorans]|jgi:hypothetical protein